MARAVREAFFDHYLKGGPDPKTPPVLTYATGINQWQSSTRWPMGAAKPIYLAAGGVATFDRPKASGHDEYLSDPAKPVPFIPRPINMNDATQWKPWLVRSGSCQTAGRGELEARAADKQVHIMGAPAVCYHGHGQ